MKKFLKIIILLLNLQNFVTICLIWFSDWKPENEFLVRYIPLSLLLIPLITIIYILINSKTVLIKGPQGPSGPQGPQGPMGMRGKPGVAFLPYVEEGPGYYKIKFQTVESDRIESVKDYALYLPKDIVNDKVINHEEHN